MIRCLDYLPMRLSLVPRLFEAARPVHAVLIHTSLPRDGKVSLGIEVNIVPAAIAAAHEIGALGPAQMNPQMPCTFGDAEVPLDAIDGAIEVEEPRPSPREHPSDDAAQVIGERIAHFATDGSFLQIGIGQIPVVAATMMADRHGLRVWSEMISDSVMDLTNAGALEECAPVVASFLAGSPALYAWANGNDRIRLVRTETVNDPARIAAHPRFLSVNPAMQVDLFAQVNASSINNRIHSGFGGQPDFVTGALHSAGGHAVIALRAWHDGSDTSTVVPVLTNPVTSFQHSAVVREHGCAEPLRSVRGRPGTTPDRPSRRPQGPRPAGPRLRPGLDCAVTSTEEFQPMRVVARMAAAGAPASGTLLSGSRRLKQDSGIHDPRLGGGFGSGPRDPRD